MAIANQAANFFTALSSGAVFQERAVLQSHTILQLLLFHKSVNAI